MSPVMIEIDVMVGGSLAMWKEYFGSDSRIIGIDINPECKVHEGECIDVFIGRHADPATYRAFPSEEGPEGPTPEEMSCQSGKVYLM